MTDAGGEVDGEDIMEQVGSNPSRVFGTVHTLAGSGGASIFPVTMEIDHVRLYQAPR